MPSPYTPTYLQPVWHTPELSLAEKERRAEGGAFLAWRRASLWPEPKWKRKRSREEEKHPDGEESCLQYHVAEGRKRLAEDGAQRGGHEHGRREYNIEIGTQNRISFSFGRDRLTMRQRRDSKRK